MKVKNIYGHRDSNSRPLAFVQVMMTATAACHAEALASSAAASEARSVIKVPAQRPLLVATSPVVSISTPGSQSNQTTFELRPGYEPTTLILPICSFSFEHRLLLNVSCFTCTIVYRFVANCHFVII